MDGNGNLHSVMTMLSRSIALATILCAGASQAVADDPGKAPCDAMARELREFALAHPASPIDTGHFEFLKAAANLGFDAEYLPPAPPNIIGQSIKVAEIEPWPDRPLTALGGKPFDSIASALGSLNAGSIDDASAYLQDSYFDDEEQVYTNVYDLRPYSSVAIISQTQGTMHCTLAAAFRIDANGLVPLALLAGEVGDVCWESGITAMRIGSQAFPATWSIQSADNLNYSIALFDVEHSRPETTNTLCTVSVAFSPNEVIADWYPSPDASPDLVSRLRPLIDAYFHDGKRDGAFVGLEPKPDGNSPYDNLLRTTDRSDQQLLRALDPDPQMAEIPNADDQAYIVWESLDNIPEPDLIEIDGHRLLFFAGEPTFGWRTSSDLAFAVWEWNGKNVVPVVSGYLGTRATNPTIKVE